MKSIYVENDDILQICVSDKSIVREVEQVWHTNISYAEESSFMEIIATLAVIQLHLCLSYTTR